MSRTIREILEELFPPVVLPAFCRSFDCLKIAAEGFVPPPAMSVAEAAEKYRYVKTDAYEGLWSNDPAPYMVEPMNTVRSPDYEAIVFCGPAQSLKTASLVENVISHAITCDPRRTRLIEKDQAAARRFSRERLQVLNRHSPEIARRKSRNANEDNIHDKRYNGMTLEMGWPSENWLAGDPVPLVILTDYDRFKEDVGGEGEVFDLAAKRPQTFGRRGKTIAESSPSKPITDPDWKQKEGSHEAPPVTGGILSLYNRGDRRLFFWQCPECGEHFESDFSLLRWNDTPDIEEAAASVYLECPHCKVGIPPEFKYQLNKSGLWLPEGLKVDKYGELHGEARKSKIASFWLKGTAAAFQQWDSLVRNYLVAKEAFDLNGKEDALKVTVNVDQGKPYRPEALKSEEKLDAETLKENAADYELRTVPPEVRFLTAFVDVQAHYYDVQVEGCSADGQIWVIDKFRITRPTDVVEERLLDPAKYDEDWQLITDQVVNRKYRLASDDREMGIYRIGIDMHGAPGVSKRARDYWKALKKDGLGSRVRLCRGEHKREGSIRVYEDYPDSKRKGKNAGLCGEVPVIHFNTRELKDEVYFGLVRETPGDGWVHFSQDLPDSYWLEVASEKRVDDLWKKKHQRNEAWDQLYCNRGLRIWLGYEKINWDSPPAWARDFDENSLVSSPAPVGKTMLPPVKKSIGSTMADMF